MKEPLMVVHMEKARDALDLLKGIDDAHFEGKPMVFMKNCRKVEISTSAMSGTSLTRFLKESGQL